MGPGDKQRRGAKDTHIYPWLTWLTVRYWLGTGNQVLASLHLSAVFCSVFGICAKMSLQDKLLDLIDHIILLAQRVELAIF